MLVHKCVGPVPGSSFRERAYCAMSTIESERLGIKKKRASVRTDLLDVALTHIQQLCDH